MFPAMRWRLGCLGMLVLLTSTASSAEMLHLSNEHLDVTFDSGNGRIALQTKSGITLLRGASAGTALEREEVSLADQRYSRRHERNVSADPRLPGERLILRGKDQQSQLDLEYNITLLRDRAAVVFELKLTNVSEKDLLVRQVEPLRAIRPHGGCLFGSSAEVGAPIKALTNGYIYYDPGHLYDFSAKATAKFDSFWNAAFHIPKTGQTLVAGFLENREGEGHIVANSERGNADGAGRRFELIARSFLSEHFVLKPGASVSSGRLLLTLSADPFTGLEFFAETSARLHDVKLNPVINGWSTWSGFYGDINEEKVLKQARFIAKELKPYGMEWVQIDDGYYRAFGDWEGRSDRFPHGMKWLADQIRGLGLKPGLWIAPFAISAETDVAKHHLDWLLHDPDGQIQPIEKAHQNQAQYILDITHPQARKWLFDLFHTISADWGYDFIKTDFVEWTLLAGRKYHDPTMSKASAYRLGVQTMRDAIGPQRHLLDCGPGPEVVGLIDSMRIELDRPIPENPLWDQYAGHYNSTAPAVAKRYYFNNRTWINDSDHLRLAQLTVAQAQAAVTITALSGGTMIAGDRLDELDPQRLDAVKKVFPAYGQAARPFDLFETTNPALFAHEIHKPFGDWWIAGVFNWKEVAETRELKLSKLGLDPKKTYLAYKFWSQRLIGETKDVIRLELPPTSVHCLAIHEKRDVPQVISTDRHYTQGGIEFESVQWDEPSKTLSGIAIGHPQLSWNLAIHVPPPYRWTGSAAGASHLSNVSYDAPLLRGRVGFDQSGRTNWSVRFLKQ